jgi:hypothetical protein
MAGAGFVLGWLVSKSWADPGCRLGLAIFLALAGVLVLVFVLAVVGHGRAAPRSAADEDDDERPS